MATAFYLADNTTLATALAFGPTAAGDTSATQTLHLWYNKGTAGGIIANVSIQAVDPTTGLDTGAAWLDETWLEARLNGGSNPSADPAFRLGSTGWYKLGAGNILLAPDLPGNCAIYVELRLHPPLTLGAPIASVDFSLVVNYNAAAVSLVGGLSDLGEGIVTGVGDRTVTEWVEAPTVLATAGTPDALVHVAKRWYVYNGISLRTYATDNLTLDQNDSASAALTTGHEYKALISQPPGAGTADVASVVTKGFLAATGASAAPALPTGNLLIAVVNVVYNASASVINQSDITVSAADGRGKPTIGTGLHVNIAALRAIMPGARIINRSARIVAVTGNASPITSYLWLGPDDAVTVVPTSTTPPFSGALPICSCVANATTVTDITDLRTYFEPNARIVALKSVFGFNEPRLFPKIATVRQNFAINQAAYTDCTLPISGDVILLAVAGYWKNQPGGSTTADIGVDGTTTLYATATSTATAATFTGLQAGPLYYAAAPVIRVTPDAVTVQNGNLEITAVMLGIRNSSTQPIGRTNVPYAWNLDRMVATCYPSGNSATGATTFDVQLFGTSICQSGAQPSIAAQSTSDASAYPSITVGGPGVFNLYLSSVTHSGANDEPWDVQVDLVLVPMAVV